MTEAQLPSIRPLVAGGVVIVALGLGGLLAWAGFSTLSSAAIAPGVVVPKSGRQPVQHLEGGIIRDIFVEEGEAVEEGAPLALLDDTRTKASFDLLQGRFDMAEARRLRLEAERDGLPAPAFAADLTGRAPEAVSLQHREFAARNEAFAGEVALLKQRVKDLDREAEGITAERSAVQTRTDILDEQLKNLEPLMEKGFARRDQVLSIRDRLAEAQGQIGRLDADLARTHQKRQEVDLEIQKAEADRRREVVRELREVEASLADLSEQRRAAQDRLDRSVIAAPMAGVVTSMRVRAAGAVVTAGGTLMDIVPVDAEMVVEARLGPDDADVVHGGLPVHIRLNAFNRRRTDPLSGEVTTVAPDSERDESGRPYFPVQVRVDWSGLPPDVPAVGPGMQAEVEILLGQRSALAYLLDPLTRALGRSFREQ
ncbi:MAG: HlyD family type I secretion periplasmic adaptor subunit [Rhodospirillales bacterium]